MLTNLQKEMLRGPLVWLCTPESMPSICLVYGFGVAWGGFARPFHILHSAFYIFPSMALGGFGRLDTSGSRSSKTRTFLPRFFVRAQESPRKLALPVETRMAEKARMTKAAL